MEAKCVTALHNTGYHKAKFALYLSIIIVLCGWVYHQTRNYGGSVLMCNYLFDIYHKYLVVYILEM